MNNPSKSKLDGKISMFVGMDLHKNYLQIPALSAASEVCEVRYQNRTGYEKNDTCLAENIMYCIFIIYLRIHGYKEWYQYIYSKSELDEIIHQLEN